MEFYILYLIPVNWIYPISKNYVLRSSTCMYNNYFALNVHIQILINYVNFLEFQKYVAKGKCYKPTPFHTELPFQLFYSIKKATALNFVHIKYRSCSLVKLLGTTVHCSWELKRPIMVFFNANTKRLLLQKHLSKCLWQHQQQLQPTLLSLQ